ncbi:ribosome-associated protein [Stenotrophomonas sp. W1S232]|uniref:Dual-action ribosomal maturation protein DarP n=1 Tax=Stenotrophomonas koreensis TaxID=266128 RepID=A0A7W3UZX9_9GAMM|nr:ribosome biogenesis factor YjgA [Stenotrophomonas koreensis]MBB1116909.1 ribosome-associated protein [Stenotrophomonas koreensis]
MRGRDEETGEYRDISRSENRRQALEVLALGEQLVGLTAAQLAKLPIPEDLMPHIEYTKRITSHGARKRQLAFLAKQMRRESDETLQAIRDVLDASSEVSRREVAQMHRVEQWRERLLSQGDAALAELIAQFPDADRQQLRTLVRNALAEKARNKPPRAFRELFQVLRELLASGTAAGLAEDAAEPDTAPADADEAEFDFDDLSDEDLLED